MIYIEGYENYEKIHEGTRSIVYRAREVERRRPVIIKLLRQSFFNIKETDKFEQEYELTRRLNLESVIKTYAILEYAGTLAIIYEDFGGESLKKYLSKGRLSIDEFLEISIKIVKCIKELHNNSIIHRDINPSNIVINPDIRKIKIIDFGISALSTKDTLSSKPKPLGSVTGTLSYISPEQTGRINRPVDYRTDFYSCGVTFYEMLSGRLPFESSDPVGIIHSHLASTPVPLDELSTEIPKVISEIVEKLMSKDPNGRYQSADGIIKDLEKCRESLLQSHYVKNFKIGGYDSSEKFIVSKKLFGRESKLEKISGSFNWIRSGHCEIIFISGKFGVGKSMVVRELTGQVNDSNGYFITGTCDRARQHMSYFPFLAALSDFFRQILTESDENLKEWKKTISEIIRNDVALIIDLIPEIEFLFGRDFPALTISAVEADIRIKLIIQGLLRVISTENTPVVLVIEDIQWIDSSSIHMIHLMTVTHELSHILIIGTYDNSLVGLSHPLTIILDDLKSSAMIIKEIKLKKLRLKDVNMIIADTLKLNPFNTEELSLVVYGKTGGNPYHVEKFLFMMHEEGYIFFNHEKKEWQWKINEISMKKYSADIFDIMNEKFGRLDHGHRYFLARASCISYEFEIETLSIIFSQNDLARYLMKSINDGFLIKVKNRYQFTNEKIFDIANNFLSPEEREVINVTIGMIIMNSADETMLEDLIFTIVEHLNIAEELIVDKNERERLASLNLKAAKKAQQLASYDDAIRYYESGLSLMDISSWENSYEMAWGLYLGLIESLYISRNIEKLNSMLEKAETLPIHSADQIDILEYRIQLYISTYRLQEAVSLAIKAFNILGISFPEKPSKLNIFSYYMKVRFQLFNKSEEELLNLPPMTDKNTIRACRIISNVISAFYFSYSSYFPLLLFKLLSLILNYGNTAESAQAFVFYSSIICGYVGDYIKGHNFGKIALRLLKKHDNRKMEPRVLLIYNIFVSHWVEPLEESTNSYLDGYKMGLETGDLEFTCLSAFLYCTVLFFTGFRLDRLLKKFESYGDIITKLKQQTIANFINIEHQTVSNLVEKINNPCILSGKYYNENESIPFHILEKDNIAISVLYIMKTSLGFIFEDYESAVLSSTQAEKYVRKIISTPLLCYYFFFRALTIMAVYKSQTLSEKHKSVIEIKKILKMFEKWGSLCAENYLSQFYLLKAEFSRIHGRKRKAISMYDKAIIEAEKHGKAIFTAIINEVTARFYLSLNKTGISRMFFIEARHHYMKWGADNKVRHLQGRYPEMFFKDGTCEIEDSESTSIEKTVDLATLIKTQQAISGEIVFKRLLQKLIKIIIENAGATSGFLILESRGKLFIEAEMNIPKNYISIATSEVVDGRFIENVRLPVSIINYVARSMESVVLNDAYNEGKFKYDRYIIKNRSKSILCLPIITQDKLLGILYLENQLSNSVFNSNRTELLKSICSQAAISIQNSRLYYRLEEYSRTLEERVKERTSDLARMNETLVEANSLLTEARTQAMNDMALAANVQSSFLPKSCEDMDWDVAFTYEPLTGVSGDFYDFYEKDGKLRGVGLFDVSGHGISSGLITVIARSIVHHNFEENLTTDLGLVMRDINENLIKEIYHTQNYLTGVLLRFNGNIVEYVNCAHPSIIKKDSVLMKSHVVEMETEDMRGKFLGISYMRSIPGVTRINMNKGDSLVIFSDCLNEGRNRSKRPFGAFGIIEALDSSPDDSSAKSILDHLLRKYREFVGKESNFDDDLTVMVVKRTV